MDKFDFFIIVGKIVDLCVCYIEVVVDVEVKVKEKQYVKGKMIVWECIELLVDFGSFVEFDEYVCYCIMVFGMDCLCFYGDFVVIGVGMINGCMVVVYLQDFFIFGGLFGEVVGEKIVKIMEFVFVGGMFCIGIFDFGGVCIQEGVVVFGKYGEIFCLNICVFGVILQIFIIMGLVVGGVVYFFVLMDFVIMVDKISQMFVIGLDVIKMVIGEDVGMEEFGGVYMYNIWLGVVYYFVEDEDDVIDYVCMFFSFLLDNNMVELLLYESMFEFEIIDVDCVLNMIVFDFMNQLYDIYIVIEYVVDEGDFFEVQLLFVFNIVIGFGCVEGCLVGIIVNQLFQMVGMLNIEVGEKVSCFVCFCDVFFILIVMFVDVFGYFFGIDQEWIGVICCGVKLFYVYVEVIVLLVMVILCKVYGGVYIVMGLKQLGVDVNFVWLMVEIVVMGGQGVVNILYCGEIKKVEEVGEDVVVVCICFVNEYIYNVVLLFLVVECGEFDGIIELVNICVLIVKVLWVLCGKCVELLFKKYGNILL